MRDPVSNKCRNAEENANESQADRDAKHTIDEIAWQDSWLHSDF